FRPISMGGGLVLHTMLRAKHRYLFHIHTNYTDGQLSIDQYFEYAEQTGVQLLVFLEHIRKESSYDVARFVEEIRGKSRVSRIPALVGFEAKLLPTGELDIRDEDAEKADVIGIAEHSFPKDPQLLFSAFSKAVHVYSLRYEGRLVWVHPGLSFQKWGGREKYAGIFSDMLHLAISRNIYVERNMRYELAASSSL